MGSICPSDSSSSSAHSGRHHNTKRSHSDSEEDSSSDDNELHSKSKGRVEPSQQENISSKSASSEPIKKISFGLSQKPAAGNKIGFGGFKMGISKPSGKIQTTVLPHKPQPTVKVHFLLHQTI